MSEYWDRTPRTRFTTVASKGDETWDVIKAMTRGDYPKLDQGQRPLFASIMRQLRNKQIPLVKVLWRHHNTEEATWESEETMRQQFPQLFASGKFRGRNLN